MMAVLCSLLLLLTMAPAVRAAPVSRALTLITAGGAPAVSREPQALLADLHWRNVGPAIMGGRIDDIAADPANPAVIYVGAASGGIWKTVNGGTTWTPIFDDYGTTSIGALALAPSNPQVVWAGTGEANNRQSSSWGNGVYKSTDGGKTWIHMGLDETRHIGRIVIDPRNPDIVYVAALGHLWGPNKERGLYKTTDGGKTWTNTKFIDENTGFSDVAIDPSNPRVLYAAAYQRRRTPWGYSGGGPGSGLYKTTDAGRTWTKLTNGLPSGDMGRIAIAIYAKNPSIVYAEIENANGGVFRSENAGRSWTRVNTIDPRPSYFSQIRIDPRDDQRIYALGGSLAISDDGGQTFRNDGALDVHVDHHAMWIDPARPSHIVLGNDGGVWISEDRAETWRAVNNMPIGQVYIVDYDNSDPYRLYAGLQDNDVWEGPSATRDRVGPINDNWVQVATGDGMYAAVDPHDPSTIYTDLQDGRLLRLDNGSYELKSIVPYTTEPEDAGTFGHEPEKIRFNWTTPVVISPHNRLTIYVAGNRLWRSLDRGNTWYPISPDLSRGTNRDTLPIMGVVPSTHTLSLNDGVEAWGTATTMMESPIAPGVILIGMDDGNLQMTKDDGAHWSNISARFPGLPDGAAPSRVVLSRFDAERMYVTFDNHRLDDYKAYVYASDDGGGSWHAIADGLPPVSVRTIAEDPYNENLLFLGTENGIWYSIDRGQSWTRLKNGLPDVPVADIKIQPRDRELILGTHGRSVYIMNIAPLEGLTPETRNQAAVLFPPQPATSFNFQEHSDFLGNAVYVGANPPYGAMLDYYLKDAVPEATLRITSPDGDVVRELKGPGTAGVHRVIWDLRRPPAPTTRRFGSGGASHPPASAHARIPGDFGGGGDPRTQQRAGNGPTVLPGRYTVTLTAGSATSSGTLEVRTDPRVEISDRDLTAQHRFLMSVYDAQLTAGKATAAVTSIEKQAADISKALASAKPAQDGTRKRGERGGTAVAQAAKPSQDGLAQAVTAFTQAMRDVQSGVARAAGALGGLSRNVSRSTSRPTVAQDAALADAQAELKSAVAALNDAIAMKVPALNQQLEAAGVAGRITTAPRQAP